MATTLTISLPEPLSSYIAEQVESGAYITPSEFVQNLVAEHREQLEKRLMESLQEKPITLTDQEWQSGDILNLAQQKLSLRA